MAYFLAESEAKKKIPLRTRYCVISVPLKRCLVPRFWNCVSFFHGAKLRLLWLLFPLSNVAETEHALSTPLNNAEAIYKANLDMKRFHQEVVRVVFLDCQLRCITKVDISRGTVNESLAAPREIFRPAIIHSVVRVRARAQPPLRQRESF